MRAYDWVSEFLSYDHTQTDRTGDVLMMLLIVGMMLWVILRNAWEERRTGEPVDPEFDERQRLVQLKGWKLALQILYVYLIGWILLSALQLADWADDVLSMGLGGLCLSALVFQGYCEIHDATRDTDRRIFPFDAVITAAIQCSIAATQWFRRTREIELWERRVQISGAAEAGPRPQVVDGIICVFTAMAAGTAILAAVALWRWFRERRHETEEA